MRPPYDITPRILQLISSVSQKLGAVNAGFLDKPTPTLRKRNKIKTIHSSLKIEGNTLTEEQITALIENKRVRGPQKDIEEVVNTIGVYESIHNYNPSSEKAFLNAHKTLMSGLIDKPGGYRQQGVGIVKGSSVKHLAPPHQNVPGLMKDLFAYLKTDEIELIKSCVFHYEMEFIHPFIDGNGRMGRLWQTLVLMSRYPMFEYLPFETLISQDQDKYYKALSTSDKEGKSTKFILYMLGVINDSLAELLTFNNRTFTAEQRLDYFQSLNKKEFARKDYMNTFKDISTATASRDLKKGIELGILIKQGEINKSRYGFR
jgi:Fic family protein|tara:strand:- start:1162 stop:2112 length:951 start_codon:yes stop_codon:yes gene_type:complete